MRLRRPGGAWCLNPWAWEQCGTNLARDFFACVTAPGVFDYAYTIAALGAQANQAQSSASVVTCFYTTNWLHDWFYDVGFDKPRATYRWTTGRGGLGATPCAPRRWTTAVPTTPTFHPGGQKLRRHACRCTASSAGGV